jgi:hypothetical protein
MRYRLARVGWGSRKGLLEGPGWLSRVEEAESREPDLQRLQFLLAGHAHHAVRRRIG